MLRIIPHMRLQKYSELKMNIVQDNTMDKLTADFGHFANIAAFDILSEPKRYTEDNIDSIKNQLEVFRKQINKEWK